MADLQMDASDSAINSSAFSAKLVFKSSSVEYVVWLFIEAIVFVIPAEHEGLSDLTLQIKT